MTRRTSMGCALLAVALAAGCATSGGASAVAEFPSAADLGAIKQRQAPTQVVQGGMDLGEGFALGAPQPGMLGDTPRAPRTRWEKMLASAWSTRKGGLEFTEETHCAAREAGRFYLERGAYPANQLRRFLLGRCGSMASDVNVRAGVMEAPPELDEAQVFERWQEALEDTLGTPAVARGTVGIWFGRADGRVAVMVAITERRARLKPVDPKPDADGLVTIEGRMEQSVGGIHGYINQGDFGVAQCEIDMGVRLPAFRALCPMADDDGEATIELYANEPGRVLGYPVATVQARRTDGLSTVFELPSYGSSAEVDDSAAFAREMVEQLNVIRARAGAGPVRLSKTQSGTAAELAPHFFAAYLRNASDVVDTIALGLLAGWEVKGMIRDGAFMSSIVAPSRDVGQWLQAALTRPSGRTTLLHPDVRELAVGSVVSGEPKALAATVVSYKFHDSKDHTADVNALFERLVRARKRLGLAAPKRLGPLMEPMKQELARVHRGQADAEAALNKVLSVGLHDLQRSMRGYRLEAISLEAVEIPDEILRAPQLVIEIGVTHHKPKGAAWAQYVVLIAYMDPGKQT